MSTGLAFIASCLLITSTFTTEGKCMFTNSNITFKKGGFVKVFDADSCGIEQKSKLVVFKGEHRIKQIIIVECE